MAFCILREGFFQMALFCFACHRTFDQQITECPFDSFALIEANFDYPPSMTVGSRSLTFESCLFPGEHIRSYAVRDQGNAETLLFETYASQIIEPEYFKNHLSNLKSLTHDNLAPVLDFGTLGEGLYYVLSDYPYGENLDEKLVKNGQLSPQLTVHLFNQLLNVLGALKEKGMVHGNIMPTAITLVEDSRMADKLKLVRMSLPESCFTREAGTRAEYISPLYLAPERVRGQNSCEATEIYSMGALMYKCLSGMPPYTDISVEALELQHTAEHILPIRGVAPELDIPALLDILALRALSKDLRGRYQSYGDMQKELLHAAKESRIYLPTGASSSYAPSVLGEQATTPPELHEEEEDFSKKAAEEEAAKIKEEEAKLDAEIEEKAKGLQSSFMLLAVLAVIAIVGGVSIFFYQGSNEDKGALYVKLSWEEQMSAGDDAVKAKSYDKAIASYEEALATAGDIDDDKERAVKALTGLLKAYEGKGDKAQVDKTRARLVEIEKQHLKEIESE